MSLGDAMFRNFMRHLYDEWVEEDERKGLRCELRNLGESSLHETCKTKSSEALCKFLKIYTGPVDLVDPDSGVTPLVTACKFGNLESVKLLVLHGANVNHSCSGLAEDEMKYSNITPIYVAAEEGNAPIVEYLGNHGADVNAQMSPLGLTPLHRAVFLKHKKVLSILVKKFEAKVGLPCVDTPGSYPIYSAIVVGDIDLVEIILSAKDADPSVPDPSEHVTPLHLAAYKGDLPAAELLISKGANVNAQLKCGHSPLDLAIQEKSRHLAEVLRQHGARRKVLDKAWHPFIFSVANGFQSMKTAVNRGADVNSLLTPKSGTALHFSVAKRRMDACKFLLRKGADIESRNVYGKTPLHIATEQGLNHYIQFLLERGANINAQTTTGFSPLHKAALLGNYATCKLLIDKGADLEIMARELGPPIIGAIHQSNTNIVKLLLKSGANPNAKNPENSVDRVTVLQIAIQFAADKHEIIEALIEAGADVKAPIVANHGTLTYLHVLPMVTNNLESLRLMIEAGAYIDSPATQTKYDPIARFCMHVNGSHGDHCMPVSYNGTPLQSVKQNGRPDSVRLLENTINLFKAVRKNDLILAKKFHLQGGLVNCCSFRYNTPLIYASWKGYVKMVEFLLAKGAKIDLPNMQNSSPLHYAAKFNQKDVAIQLLKAGAPINIVRCNKTPLELAQEHNQPEVASVLEFAEKYLSESRTKQISPVPSWKSDPKITGLISEFEGKVAEKDIAALFAL